MQQRFLYPEANEVQGDDGLGPLSDGWGGYVHVCAHVSVCVSERGCTFVHVSVCGCAREKEKERNTCIFMYICIII